MDQTSSRDIYPLLLPHVAVIQNGLYFGTQKLRPLTMEEEQVCRLCNGLTALEDISMHAGAALLTELTPFIVELPFPLVQKVDRNKSQKVLVIAPNPQTSYLSVGGTCLKWQDKEILNLLCFSNTEDCTLTGLFKSNEEISAIRHDEAEISAKLCNCTNKFLNYPDFNVRKGRWDTGSMPGLPADLAAALKYAIFNAINEFKPQIILAPAAIGNHPDHAILHNIILDFFKHDYFPGIDFFLYQDFPYAATYNLIDDFLWKTECSFVKIADHFEDVSAQMKIKELFYDIHFSAFNPVNRSLVSHILKRNITASNTLTPVEEAEGAEHFYKLIPFN
jgi:LmbE family N-acetylglucosaminyl deacetylase